MQVGDVITLAGMTGTVERLSIRTIRLRGADGSVNIIPFSAVTTVTNLTRDFSYAQLSIDVSYESDLTPVYEVLRDIVRESGLDEEEYFRKIALPEYKEKLKANTDELIARGGFGSPTMFADGDMYFGNDRLELVAHALVHKH